jgi:phosphoglycerol transferase MdoB-like AlkP superfamily enzyme
MDNNSFFSGTNWKEKALILWWGFIMDLSGIILLSLPSFLFIFMSQYMNRKNKLLVFIARGLFVILHAGGFAINILDAGYFPFIKHRSNIDLWFVFGDSSGSFFSIVKAYWPLLLLFFLLTAGLILFAKKVFVTQVRYSAWYVTFARQLMISGGLLLFVRGLEERPLIPASPLLQINAKELPLAQNSINTMMYSFIRRQRELGPKNYFPPDSLSRIITSNHFLHDGSNKESGSTVGLIKKNIVICILESFSGCYLKPGDPLKAKTPFFDSLIRKSIYFPNAFANAFTSNQGIVAILGGLPGFLDEPFYYSEYANTPIRSIGNILKENRYNTNFFLGAGKDHFGFGKFTRMAGIDHYYSGTDFNDDRFYDGNWGVYDEPFLQFGANILAQKQQPFFAVFFNISSHPPFTIPAEHRNDFDFPDQSPAQRSISYVDYCFRRFFETCMHSAWFKNSIFVFCADHWLYPGKDYPFNYVNCGSIPIFIFDPSKDQGQINETVASQVDITPTLLDLIKYTGNYTGFGTSLLDSLKGDRYAINKPGAVPQIITKDYVLGYDISREESTYLYHYQTDSLLRTNLIKDQLYAPVRKKLEEILKANIQCYNQALIRRSLE